MDEIMNKWGYTYEPLQVTTEDGYILTTFHVTGKKDQEPFKPTQPPVLVQHGDYQDAASWLSEMKELPMQLKLADAGYDVFLGNNRGTWYSQKHEEYDPVNN